MAYDPATKSNKDNGDIKAEPLFHSRRTAEFGGKISWRTLNKYTKKITYNKHTYKFELQTTAWYAVVSRMMYKDWRVVMIKGKLKITGRVIGEFDTKDEGIKFLEKVENSFKIGFDEKIDENGNEDPDLMCEVLHHGDVISVDSGMGRHFAIYDAIKNSVIEYQKPPGGMTFGRKGEIVETGFNKFCQRSKKGRKRMNIRKHIFNEQNYVGAVFDGNEAVERARNNIGGGGYHAATKNCETFVMWCKTGNGQSMQSLRNSECVIDAAIKVCMVVAAGVALYQLAVLVLPTITASVETGGGVVVGGGILKQGVDTFGKDSVKAAGVGVGGGVVVLGGGAELTHNKINDNGSQNDLFDLGVAMSKIAIKQSVTSFSCLSNT